MNLTWHELSTTCQHLYGEEWLPTTAEKLRAALGFDIYDIYCWSAYREAIPPQVEWWIRARVFEHNRR